MLKPHQKFLPPLERRYQQAHHQPRCEQLQDASSFTRPMSHGSLPTYLRKSRRPKFRQFGIGVWRETARDTPMKNLTVCWAIFSFAGIECAAEYVNRPKPVV